MVSSNTLYAGEDLFVNRVARDKEQLKDLLEFMRAQSKLRKDYVVPAKGVSVVNLDGVPQLAVDHGGFAGQTSYSLRGVAHDQLGQAVSIPAVYYDRLLLKDTDLWQRNVNRWLPELDRNFLVRTMGDTVTALLSDVYFPLGNVSTFFNGFKAANERGAEVIRVQLSEKRFYAAFVNHDWAEDVETKDGFTRLKPERVAPLVTISNSESGHGGLNVEIGMFNYICINHMVWSRTLDRVHRGKRMEVGFISPETRKLEAEMVYSVVKDAVTAAFNRDTFRAMVARMSDATAEVVDKPEETLAVLQEQHGLSDGEFAAFMNEFISPTVNQNTGPTVYGLMNALTFVAQQAEDPNREMELVRIGGAILRDPKKAGVVIRTAR
jgi:hypothetical protein